MKKFLTNIYDLCAMEVDFIRRDKPLLIILFGAMVLYSIIYSIIYAPEVYNDVKIVVVDSDNTARSRDMIRELDSSPYIKVAERANSLVEAKQRFLDHKVFGIIVIPEGFERNIERGDKATFGVYADASYFLSFKQTFYGAVNTMLEQNNNIEVRRFEMVGKSDVEAEFLSEPIKLESVFLFNRYQGYATFAIPCVLFLIIQQTLLIGLGMVSGVWSERGLFKKNYASNGVCRYNAFEYLCSKIVVYTLIELLLFCYVLFVEYKIFGYPANGSIRELFSLLIPYVFASIFLGVALSPLFKYRETSIITYFASSLPLLVMSGITWTEQAMPDLILGFTKIFPSTSGINAFVRMQTMGASLSDVSADYYRLWILVAIFFCLALYSSKVIIRRVNK